MTKIRFHGPGIGFLDTRYVNITGDTMTGDLQTVDLKLSGGDIYPTADSTTAIQINKADGTTNVLNVDTTNARVGIGTTGPGAKLDVYSEITDTSGTPMGQRIDLRSTPSGASTANSTGLQMLSRFYGTNNQTQITGLYGSAIDNATAGTLTNAVGTDSLINYLSASGTHTLTNAISVQARMYTSGTAYGTITNLKFIDTGLGSALGANLTVTNGYGLYINALPTLITNKWGIYQAGTDNNYFAGNVGIGTTGPTHKLQVSGVSGVFDLESSSTESWMDFSPDGGTRAWAIGHDAGLVTNGFFIYDSPAGKTPFKIYPSSVDNTLVLNAGNVGIGTTAPGAPLAVNKSSDGTIVNFESADTVEGSVSISGAITSYNAFLGSHYTQLKDRQEELPVGAVVVSTGEIIPCERNKEVETVKKVEVVVKDAIETIEIPAVEAVKEVTEAQYFVEDGKILSKEIVITKAQEAVSASTEKKLKENHVLDEKIGKIYREDKTVTPTPQDVSNKEYFTYVDTTTKPGDKRVYGVWFSKLEDDSKEMSFGENGKPVYLIAQVGLFKIRVTDTNGDIAVGDFLETSTRAMEAQKQTSGTRVNSTVAKALTDVKWADVAVDKELGYKVKLIPCIF